MTTEIADFIKKLDALMVELEKVGYPGEDDSFYLHDLPERYSQIRTQVKELDEEASGIFIIGSGRLAGQADFSRHRILKNLSSGKYRITKGESDSWGWLSGKLCTPRGIIVFG